MNINLKNELAIIELSGEDSTKFLQGQITNDINLLNELPWIYAAHLNNKGRIIANFIITKVNPQAYYLILALDLVETVLKRLNLFKLRSKVNLNQVSLNLELTEDPGLLSLPIGNQHLNLLTATNSPENPNLWHQFLVEHDIPLIYQPTSEQLIPQQINYDLMNGVNFKKGCYIGQEIVARLHYLGQIKQRLFKFESIKEPKIGQKLISPRINNQACGIIVDYYLTPDNKYIGLASILVSVYEDCYLDPQSKLTTYNLLEGYTL